MELLNKEFERLLLNVGSKYKEDELTALYPCKGNKYNSELMVVGRATNGWGAPSWKKGKPTIKEMKGIAKEIINYSAYGDKKGECPMKWIIDHWGANSIGNQGKKEKEKYNMKKSAFWRVIKEVLIELKTSNAEEAWSSYLVWTNLYLINSNRKGDRNPSNKLCDAQFENSKLILKEEISSYKPKRVLFLTGYDWFKDFETDFKGKQTHGGLVDWIGNYKKTKVVVAKHPERKNENLYVKQVIKAFSSL